MPYSAIKLDNQTQGGSGNSNALRWLKTPVAGSLVIVLLSVILGIAIRVCPLRSFNEDSCVGPDSSRIIRQAKWIAENGSLPEWEGVVLPITTNNGKVDCREWLPSGAR